MEIYAVIICTFSILITLPVKHPNTYTISTAAAPSETDSFPRSKYIFKMFEKTNTTFAEKQLEDKLKKTSN